MAMAPTDLKGDGPGFSPASTCMDRGDTLSGVTVLKGELGLAGALSWRERALDTVVQELSSTVSCCLGVAGCSDFGCCSTLAGVLSWSSEVGQ